MSLSTTKAHLIQILSEPYNKVVALSGKWGTGKSHLWREVMAASNDDKVKGALYVSLFGLTSMDQVKLKIVQSAIPNADKHPSWWDNAKKSWGAASKLLESVHKGFSALNEIALLAVPSILKDRMIVLDDIERKHDRLNVDEIMGFIDEFTQQHGARIILILNSDKLADRKIWDTFREKVIDQEVTLETSPIEAFDIAISLTPSPYATRIRTTVETCGVTNIRIICKIIRAINQIIGSRKDLSDDILERVIPSTVLLAAIHYKGIEDGPEFDFILNIGNGDQWGDWGKKVEDLDEAGKRRTKWRILIHEIGIISCDKYEQIVIEFLRSGLFDGAEVAKIIDLYASEAEAMEARGLAQVLHAHILWNQSMSESELLAEAETLVERAHHLDAPYVTLLHDLISGLSGGSPVADAMIDQWVLLFQAPQLEGFDYDDFDQQPIHPRLKEKLNATKAAAHAKTTVFEAFEWVVRNRSWGNTQEATLKSATVQDFESTIKSLDTQKLKFFMHRFLDMYVQRATYEASFGKAPDNFIEACRNIHTAPDSGRLGSIIQRVFKNAHLETELIPPTIT
ncbi:NTPase KAP [Pseudomonas sp. CVAP|uniref:NTPase KAP n=1 Tax=Pseudomonas sp. CVAP\|nr:NTPase KAP [Pseudomonas sp. CVAP\